MPLLCHHQSPLERLLGAFLASLAVTVIWAAIAAGYAVYRNWRLHRQLVASIKCEGMSFGVAGFGVTIHNKTDRGIIVREVLLDTEPAPGTQDSSIRHLSLNYMPDRIGASGSEISDQIIVGDIVDQARRERRHTYLPADAEGTWGISPHTFHFIRPISRVNAIRIICEYGNLFGATTVTTVCASRTQVQWVEESLMAIAKDPSMVGPAFRMPTSPPPAATAQPPVGKPD